MFGKLFGKARDTRKPRRASSRRDPRRRFVPHIEDLERRVVPFCSFTSVTGVLSISCTGRDTVIVDHTDGSTEFQLQGSWVPIPDSNFGSISISGGTQGLTTTIRGTVRPLTIVGHHDGDVVNVGDLNNRVQNIQAPLRLENPPSHNDVWIHDEGDPSARSINVFVGSIAGADYEQVQVGSAEIDCKTADTRNIYLLTGNGSTTYVYDTPGVVGTTIVQRGTGLVNVGRSTLATINGPLWLLSGSGRSTLNIIDQLDGVNRTVTIGSAGITGLSNGPIYLGDSAISDLVVHGGTGNNTYIVTGTPATSSLTLDTGAGRDTTSLQANTVPTTITTTGGGGGGNDAVYVGSPAGSLAGIRATVMISNGPSSDHVFVDGSADGGSHNVTIADAGPSAGVAGLAPAEIHFTSASVSTLSVFGGTGNNAYTVASTPALAGVALDMGSGIDTTNVQTTTAPLTVTTTRGDGGGHDMVNIGNANGLARIAGTVTIFSLVSRDNIFINDRADDADHPNVVISNAGRGGVTGLAPADINFTSAFCNTLVVNTGTGNNTVTIPSTPANTLVTVNTRAGGAAAVNVQGGSVPVIVHAGGADTVTISNTDHTVDGIAGVAVSGNANSTVVVDDSGYSGDETYSITRNTLNAARLGTSPLLTYGGLGRLVLFGGNAATNDLFTVDSTSSPVDVYGGVGPTSFRISPVSNSLASIAGPLTVTGGGADVISFWDQLNPASETYTFDPVPGILTLTTVPVEVDFSGMGGGVYLQTNGASTVDDPSGSVIVDGSPPCAARGPGGPELAPAIAGDVGLPALTAAAASDVPASGSVPGIVSLTAGRSHARAPEKSLDWPGDELLEQTDPRGRTSGGIRDEKLV
jgi:hypothetical protein